MSTKAGSCSCSANNQPHGIHVDETEQSRGLLWSAILASALAMIASGGGMAFSTVNEDLSPHYTSVAIGLAVLSLLPIVYKCFAFRRSSSPKATANRIKIPTKQAEKCSCHNGGKPLYPNQQHDDKTHDTRSTCSNSLYSNSRRCHRRQTSTSTHDSEFLKSIRNQKSVLDCPSQSTDDGERPAVDSHPRQHADTVSYNDQPDGVVGDGTTNAETPAGDVQTWLDAVVGGDENSPCSSFEEEEESRHPLSPTGYISLVKAFSSHTMGADDDDDEITVNEETYWNQTAKEDHFDEDEDRDEIPLNPNGGNSESTVPIPSPYGTLEFVKHSTSAKDALTAMLEETLHKMEESSKRMRNVMVERVQTLKLSTNNNNNNNNNNNIQSSTTDDSRDDELNFQYAASACGTLNLALRTTKRDLPEEQREKQEEEEDRDLQLLPVEFSPIPYPFTRSVPRLSTNPIHSGNVRKGRDSCVGTASTTDAMMAVQDEVREDSSEHDRSVTSMLSAPDDEKQQDAQLEIEEDEIILPNADTKSTVNNKKESLHNFSDEMDFVGITQSLSMSIQRIDLSRGVQCHGGIESVASS
ncbi:hypothetical protein IV203_022160 [Nitzschia inconspicua]|uniref:Uncharacterized protein n=1 Tax=Nitzschia inconspicua TaxID=303405 RepID=A0A9K3KIE3_9STRA|nr:hypothetical protein IV203_022160 [Nitzschia inconspicua]